MQFTEDQIKQEADRLFEKLKRTNLTWQYCFSIAPITLEINILKKEQNAIILAHSYQTPDIMYGVADFLGDSYGLAKLATGHEAKKIVFCSVHFMAETVKILNPKKQVLVPAIADCSLAKSITVENVINLKKEYHGAPVVCYVNTNAAIKAESDICCTSSNALKIIDSLPEDEIIFIPDKLMGQNLQKLTKKKLILWHGTCIVHEQFDKQSIEKIRAQFPDTKILAHYECTQSVIKEADLIGSTKDILEYVKNNQAEHYMLVTECGVTDRVQTEFPNKNIVGSCRLCPYMKQIKLQGVLQVMREPTTEQIIEIPNDILIRAKKSLDKMLSI